MLSNTCDARRRFAVSQLRVGRLLGYTMRILVIIMVRELLLDSLKVGRCVEHLRIYKVLQRGYKVSIIYFFGKSKSFKKIKIKDSLCPFVYA